MRNFLCRNLHAHIAASYHDAVARLNDGINIFNSFFILDFRDNLHGRTFFIQNLPDLADRIGIADKRSRHKIKACIHAETNVFLIFIGQCRKLDTYPRYIDTLLLAQLAAIFNPADDICSIDLPHVQLDQTIVNQNAVTRLYILRQPRIVDVAACLITHDLLGRQCIQIALFQRHFLSIF